MKGFPILFSSPMVEMLDNKTIIIAILYSIASWQAIFDPFIRDMGAINGSSLLLTDELHTHWDISVKKVSKSHWGHQLFLKEQPCA